MLAYVRGCDVIHRNLQVCNKAGEFNEACLLGCTGKQLAKSVYHHIEFMRQQSELLSLARQEEVVGKSKEAHQQMYAKLEELHNAYKKACLAPFVHICVI
jgi:hypothetical protein